MVFGLTAGSEQTLNVVMQENSKNIQVDHVLFEQGQLSSLHFMLNSKTKNCDPVSVVGKLHIGLKFDFN